MNNIQYILKDKPLAAWSMDSDSFPNIYDLSGNFHDGVYNHNTLYNLEIFPLLGGSNNGILIDNSKGLSFPNIEIADANNSNNAFSIELWVYIKNSNSEYINLFSSSSNEISIKYKKGGIYFNVGSETTVAKVDNSKRVLHIVATYTPQYICLYINGTRLSKKILNNFKFNIINDSNTTFNIGPTNDQNSFIIDDVSVYKYELSDNQILNHYNYPSTNSPEQVAYKNSGVVFYGNDSSLYSSIKRSYPSQISWKNFYSDEILYSSTDNSLSLSPGVNQSFIYDSFTVLPAINILSSKIEWDDAEGVNLYVSTTGEPDSYSLCKNGYSIPGWTSDIVSKPITIYLKIELVCTDSNIFSPKLKNINLYFFSEKNFYADNSGDYISIENPASEKLEGQIYDISGSTINYPPYQRNFKMGFRPDSDGGFCLNTLKDIKSIEMILKTAESSVCSLIYNQGGDVYYFWDNYSVNSSKIDSIYINGHDITSLTNLSNYINDNEIYHIIINFSDSTTLGDKVYFNAIPSDDHSYINGASGSSYSNISLYPNRLSPSECLEHYNLYKYISYGVSEVVSIPIVEDGVYVYNNDWKVIKSI